MLGLLILGFIVVFAKEFILMNDQLVISIVFTSIFFFSIHQFASLVGHFNQMRLDLVKETTNIVETALISVKLYQGQIILLNSWLYYQSLPLSDKE